MQSEIDRIRILNSIEHRLALPPGVLFIRVEVRQVSGVVVQFQIERVTVVTRPRGARLHAVILGRDAAHVWNNHGTIKGCVLKFRQATVRVVLLIITRVHSSKNRTQGGKKQKKKRKHEVEFEGIHHSPPRSYKSKKLLKNKARQANNQTHMLQRKAVEEVQRFSVKLQRHAYKSVWYWILTEWIQKRTFCVI